MSVNAGGKVNLDIDVSTTDKDDSRSSRNKRLKCDGSSAVCSSGLTFWGKDITLTAAQVESGLTLKSHNWGSHHPVATLAVTRSEERRVGKECRSRWSPYH